MIVDGRGGAEVRYWESHKDHRLGREVCVRERAEKGYNVLAVLFVVDEFRRVHVRKDALRVHDKLCCRRR
jgi:hypothetical protein